MNLTRFNHPGFTNFFDNMEKNHNGLHKGCKGNVPSVNVIENEQDFIIEIAAPGVSKEEFNINLENQVLTISREIKEDKEEKKENYTRREFVYGSFERSFTLPKNIKYDDIVADYNQGILNLNLPKNEETKLSREIKIS